RRSFSAKSYNVPCFGLPVSCVWCVSWLISSADPFSMTPAVTDLIPHRPPFLFIDRILEHDGAHLVASRAWRTDEDFYRGHYPEAPITPGVLLCEAVFQAGAAFMSLQARATGAAPGEGVPLLAKISDVRFRNPVFPGDEIVVEVKKKEALGGF